GDATDDIEASWQTGREVEDQRRRVQPCESHAEQGDPSCNAEQPIQPPTPAHSSVLPRLDQIPPNSVVKLQASIMAPASPCCFCAMQKRLTFEITRHSGVWAIILSGRKWPTR